jgi:SAM-dependent methyltransferase
MLDKTRPGLRLLRASFYQRQAQRLQRFLRPGRQLPKLGPSIADGKSVVRSWLEWKLGTLTATGWILDVGGGGSKNTRLMQLAPTARVVTVDIRSVARPTVVCDLERGLPFRDNALDVALAFNVLEHIYDYAGVVAEIGRVLRPGGVLYLYVPFFYHRHTARYDGFVVDDYFRYGPTTLRRLLTDVGNFREGVKIEACGYGPFTACASIVGASIPFGFARYWAYQAGTWCDRLAEAHRDGAPRPTSIPIAESEWPLAYWVEAVK